jgi:hypothetical protein
MYRYTIYNLDGNLLEQAEQEEPVDIEALCKKHDLGYWKHTHRIEKFKMTIWWCYRGRIHVKYVKEED